MRAFDKEIRYSQKVSVSNLSGYYGRRNKWIKKGLTNPKRKEYSNEIFDIFKKVWKVLSQSSKEGKE